MWLFRKLRRAGLRFELWWYKLYHEWWLNEETMTAQVWSFPLACRRCNAKDCAHIYFADADERQED